MASGLGRDFRQHMLVHTAVLSWYHNEIGCKGKTGMLGLADDDRESRSRLIPPVTSWGGFGSKSRRDSRPGATS